MRAAKRLIRLPRNRKYVLGDLEEKLLSFKNSNFIPLNRVYENIDKYYEEMKKFVDNI